MRKIAIKLNTNVLQIKMYHNLEVLTERINFWRRRRNIVCTSLLYPYTFLCKAEQINRLHFKISNYVLHTEVNHC